MEYELNALAPAPPVDPKPEPDQRPLLKVEPKTPETQIPPTNQSIEELEKKYASFVREDVYGAMGSAKLPLSEKFLLGLGMLLLLPIRVVAGTFLLFIYYAICKLCTAFLAPHKDEEQEDYAHIGGFRRTIIMQTGRILSRALLFVFGFYWINNETASRDQSEELERPGAIISNHVSYLDILYHTYFCFPSFVAKRSVAKLPLVGLISKCLGCIYVQRESKSSNFKGVSGVVNERILVAHQNKCAPKMMLFPEGTTTNGDYLLPFKTGAFLAKTPVLPVLLRYPYIRFSPAWESISGKRHVFLLLCQFVNYIEVTKLPIYYPSEQEKEYPKLYAENVRQLMAHEGNLILSDHGLADKRVYHASLSELLSQR